MPITVDDLSAGRNQVFAPEYLQAAILLYRRQGKVPGDLLAMVEAIAEAQAQLCDTLPRTGPGPDAPALPPAEWLYDAIDRIAVAVGSHSPAGLETLREFARKCRLLDVLLLAAASRSTASEPAGSQPTAPQPAASQPRPGASAAEDADGALAYVTAYCSLPAGVAVFVLRMALQPFLAWRYGAAEASSADKAFPARSTCPACGGAPLMGKHSEPDGQRFLRCSACGHEWGYPRIGCPACGETGHDQIKSLFVEGDEGHRLYLCDRCRRYLKVSDERLLGVKAYLPLEDMVTLHLDDVGRQRGYSPVAGPSGRPGAV